MKKNRPINYTIKTRQTASAEEQTYLQDTAQQPEDTSNQSETIPADINTETTDTNTETTDTNTETADINTETADTNTETADTNTETADPNTETADTNTETADTNTETANTNTETADTNTDTAGTNIETADTNTEETDNPPIGTIQCDPVIMATGFSLPKFNGSETPVIWISKIDAWQKFNNYNDQKILDLLPCALEGSASTWYQTMPPCNSLATFKQQLTERFQPIMYGMPLMGIRQDTSETLDQYLERAERIDMIHDIAEHYKVQATASGLLPPWRGKVLAREPKTFQELRNAVSKTQVELSDTQPQSAPQTSTSEASLANLCTVLATQMTELTKNIKAEISALHVASQPTQQQRWNNQPGRRPQYQPRGQTDDRPNEQQSFRCKGCGESGTKHLFLLVLFLCLGVPGFASNPERTIQRINYGIIFEQTTNIFLGQENWLHTFQIPLPKKIHLVELHCNSPQCKTAGHIIKSINLLRMQCMASVNTTVHQIHRLVPSTILPPKKTYFGSSRSKRGLFDFVGQISKSLFGTATSDDINALKRHMQTLNNNNVKLAQAMALQDKHLSSFITAVDKRFNNVMSAILQNHRDAVALNNLVHHSMDALDHEFVILSNLILKQTNASAQLEKALEHIKLGIHDLVKGKLSPFILSPHTIQSSIAQVQNIISDKFPQFHISHRDPLYYYSSGDFIFTRLHSNLYLTLKIPISPFLRPVSLFKVYSFPVPVNSSSNHATQLMDTPEYFLNTDDNQHYATISSNQLSHCKGTTTQSCDFNIALTASASPSCLSAIFYNQKNDVVNLCDFRYVLNILKPSLYEISPSHILLYQTTTLALDCSNGQKIIKGCSFCVMKIPCRCSVSSNNLYLPPRLGKCNNNTDKISILHPINLVLLQQFFDQNSHSDIFGDAIFEEFIQVKLPNFIIFNHSFSQYVANDKNQHLSLKRIAQAVKRDGKVFKTLTDSMIAGQVEFAVDNWPDTSGILAIIATSVASFGLIFGIWSCYKIRTLLMPLLLLHQTPSTSALTPKPIRSFIYNEALDTTNPTSIDEHIYASFTTPWPYVSLSVLTTLLVIACLATLWRKFLRTYKTAIHLEITSGPACELVNLISLPLCPNNWHIQPPQDVSSINITRSYLFFYHAEIQCTPINITNVHTNRSIKVETKQLISPFKAWRIQNIIQHPYTAYFLLSHHQYFKILD
ncbi:uncharacterized protein LOC134246997 [Saccostrea cucullata]|uniref:uncharacterized protein LOC134246997 n=1 Tax=Saccostrea cuccullata TaxID=36930 RepID=UPI002ED18C29